MSLINEALKRAKQAPVRTGAAPEADSALQPVLGPGASSRGSAFLIPVLALAALVLGCWFLSLGWRRASETTSSQRVAPTSDSSTANHSPFVLERAVAESAVTGALASITHPILPVSVRPDTDQNSAMTNAVPELTVVSNSIPEPDYKQSSLPSEPSAAPDLKLQGIFYRASKPCALINGQTLFLEDEIDGAKVAAITRQTVCLVIEGRTNVLRLR